MKYILNILLSFMLYSVNGQTYKTNVTEIYEVEGVATSKIFYESNEFRFSDTLIIHIYQSNQTFDQRYSKYHVQSKSSKIINNVESTVYNLTDDQGREMVISKATWEDDPNGKIMIQLLMNIEPKDSKVPFNFKERYSYKSH